MFRHTIRELILLTAIIAVVAAWWSDRARLSAAHANATKLADELSKETGAQVLVVPWPWPGSLPVPKK